MIQAWLQAKSVKQDAMDYIAEKRDDGLDPYVMAWAEGDPRNPQNWPLYKKWLVTVQVSLIAFIVGMAGSINSAANDFSAAKFHVSIEVMSLQTGLFLVGFGLSSPLMGPLSELSGRLPTYEFPLLIFSVFCLGSGFAPNIQTRVILRFFAGIFGAAPLSNAGGSVADMSGPLERTYFFHIFSFIGFLGVPLGPMIGGWIGEKSNEEWCDFITAILGLAISVGCFLFMPETLSPQILKARSKELRKQTGDERYMSSLEIELKSESLLRVIGRSMVQCVLFLFKEPITLCFAFYLTVVYIILFGDLESYSIIFAIYGWDAGKIGSVFAAMFVGMAFTGCLAPIVYWQYKKYVNKRLAMGKAPQPEQRLMLAIYGTWCMPISLFWGGWTAYYWISPWSIIVGQFVFGIGALCCFIASYMYIIDVYTVNAASPLATLVFLRYIVAGAGAVMFTRPMFDGMGIHWAMTFLGIISVLVSLVPIVYYIYGPAIRAKSQYAMSQ